MPRVSGNKLAWRERERRNECKRSNWFSVVGAERLAFQNYNIVARRRRRRRNAHFWLTRAVAYLFTRYFSQSVTQVNVVGARLCVTKWRLQRAHTLTFFPVKAFIHWTEIIQSLDQGNIFERYEK